MHTRFEHSLGVMHIASQLFDAIVRRSPDVLKSELGFTSDQLERDRQIVRFTALLHDTGHGPFSHAAEDLFPTDAKGKHYKHEAYSAAVIELVLKEVIEGHKLNEEFGIKAEEVASLLEGKSSAGGRLFWRQLIDGQMDADRMDYLLRDSLHTGVDYGRYDWRRLLNTIQIIQMPPRKGEELPPEPRLGVTEGGVHAAEALVLARYYMFTQVYFHKTRVALDSHIRGALKAILPDGTFPLPTAGTIGEYLRWNDWRALGILADETTGGEHGDRLRRRDHYREVFHTPESPTDGDRTALSLIRSSLGDLVVTVESSKTSTYKLEASDISVVTEDEVRRVRPLSHYSSVVRNLNQHPIEIVRLYSTPEHADAARAKVAGLLKECQ
jgi:HD superfamily phosphohydrolase